MEIESKKDIRLVGRAIREGWPVSGEVRQEVINALLGIVESRDPDLMMDAVDRLLKADKLNVDREALQQREIKESGDRRLQLLELARRVPPGELAKLASQHGLIADGTSGADERVGGGQDQKRSEASQAQGYQDPDSEGPEPPP